MYHFFLALLYKALTTYQFFSIIKAQVDGDNNFLVLDDICFTIIWVASLFHSSWECLWLVNTLKKSKKSSTNESKSFFLASLFIYLNHLNHVWPVDMNVGQPSKYAFLIPGHNHYHTSPEDQPFRKVDLNSKSQSYFVLMGERCSLLVVLFFSHNPTFEPNCSNLVERKFSVHGKWTKHYLKLDRYSLLLSVSKFSTSSNFLILVLTFCRLKCSYLSSNIMWF